MPTESMYSATSDDKSFYYSSESLSMKEERDGSDYQQKGPALTQKKDDVSVFVSLVKHNSCGEG